MRKNKRSDGDNSLTDLRKLCPAGEDVWVSYYGKDELLFFLTGPAGQSSTSTAQKGEFTLYGVVSERGGQKAKKLCSGGNPTELEAKYNVLEALSSGVAKKAS